MFRNHTFDSCILYGESSMHNAYSACAYNPGRYSGRCLWFQSREQLADSKAPTRQQCESDKSDVHACGVMLFDGLSNSDHPHGAKRPNMLQVHHVCALSCACAHYPACKHSDSSWQAACAPGSVLLPQAICKSG